VALTYTLLGNLPPGLVLDPATGVVSGIVSNTAAGQYTATIRATNPLGFADQLVSWIVRATIAPNPPSGLSAV